MNIVVLGNELEYDFFDADLLEKYEDENARVKNRIQDQTQYEGKRTAEALRIQCGIVDDFFNALFGNGTSEKLFGGKNNIKTHMEAFGQVCEAAMSCNSELSAITDKYSPNRAERRAQQNKNSRNFNRNGSHRNGKHHN
jgi:hypothetical protein|nr:MAG TPA: hypothetical protein [Caudoviricetes sp.]